MDLFFSSLSILVSSTGAFSPCNEITDIFVLNLSCFVFSLGITFPMLCCLFFLDFCWIDCYFLLVLFFSSNHLEVSYMSNFYYSEFFSRNLKMNTEPKTQQYFYPLPEQYNILGNSHSYHHLSRRIGYFL